MQTEIYSLSDLTNYIDQPILISADEMTLIGNLGDVSTSDLGDPGTRTLTLYSNVENNPIFFDITLKDMDLLSDSVTISVKEAVPTIEPGHIIYVKGSTHPKAPLNTLYSYSDSLDRWVPWNHREVRVPLREDEITDYDIISVEMLASGGTVV